MAGMYIEYFDGDGDPIVHDNRINRTFAGILAYNSGGRFTNNVLTNNGIALYLWNRDTNIANNIADRNGTGAYVANQTSGLSLHDNDFRGNVDADCMDLSSGSGTAGTANTWTNNLGVTGTPSGICADFVDLD
jgi:parallel beta-helix repeat protein